jgi:RNA polymerase sigma factor (sigma-70 family)
MSYTTAARTLLLQPQDSLRQAEPRPYVRVMEHVDGVSTAIEAVLARFRTMVRSVGVRRGLVDADLDEVMQEVRIRLWQAGKAGKAVEELGSSYLYQVATTASLDLLRRRRARAADRTDDVDELRDLPAAQPSPQDDLEATDLRAQIDAALETLAPDRRVAVRFYLNGYDRNDIARALGWSEARARNLLYRGLDDLRRRLTLMGISPARVR